MLLILKNFRAINPRVFGSTVCRDDVDGSDLDMILELSAPSTYCDVFRIEDALGELLGVRVDISMPGRLGFRFEKEVMEDAIGL